MNDISSDVDDYRYPRWFVLVHALAYLVQTIWLLAYAPFGRMPNMDLPLELRFWLKNREDID